MLEYAGLKRVKVMAVAPLVSVMARVLTWEKGEVNRSHCYLIMSGTSLEGWGARGSALVGTLYVCVRIESCGRRGIVKRVSVFYVTEMVLEWCRRRVRCWKRVWCPGHMAQGVLDLSTHSHPLN